jgi:hypothetical protein
MNELLNKISSYNLFNYLLPGIVFVVILSKTTQYNISQDDIVIGLFLYYFIGLIISRFGSLVIEPILKKYKFVLFADYKDFVIASKKDEKLEVLSEVDNTYRTLCSMFILILLIKIYEKIANKWLFLKENSILILIILLIIMFLFSYRKQTAYISKRVEANK